MGMAFMAFATGVRMVDLFGTAMAIGKTDLLIVMVVRRDAGQQHDKGDLGEYRG